MDWGHAACSSAVFSSSAENHCGRRTRNCHTRICGMVSPHWLMALTVMPRISASDFIDPASSIAFFVSMDHQAPLDRILNKFKHVLLCSSSVLKDHCWRLQAII